MARVTLQTIADRLGVSRMTVSNAFSRPDQLSGELRQRILAAAEELGYVGPDPAARALARGTTGAVGVLLTDSLQYAFTDEVATGFLGAVVDELAPTGLALTLLASNGMDDDVIPARDVAIDGALVYSCQPASMAREWLIRRKLPLVFVDQDPVPGIASINVDDRSGARAAAQHLVELGHERIGIVTVTLDEPLAVVTDLASASRGHPQKQRMLGWLDALKAAGIDPRVVQVPSNREDDGVRAARLLLAFDERPTAVLCFADVLALGVIRAADELGLVVPDELSVVGFDDSPAAQRSRPALTTVRQDVAAKGRLAATALATAIQQARTGARPRVRHLTLPTELFVRQTTAAAPNVGWLSRP
ncbi:MAG: LacI family DNA-binding transcriptional regulator [Jiangellaceae bacterium]